MNARQSFIEFIMSKGFTQSESESLYNLYRSKQYAVLSIDNITGKWSVPHGVLLDKPILIAALKIANEKG